MIFYALMSPLAWAGPVEQVGFGAPSMGRGGGGLGLAEEATDVFLNPAGLARMDGPQVVTGFGVYRMRFDAVPDVAWDTNRDGRIDAHDSGLEISAESDHADGFSFGLGRSIGDRFGLSIAGYIPLDRLMRIRSIEPSLPTWFMYENRPHRFDLAAGFGWEQLPGVYVGGSVEMLARARYDMTLTLDAHVRLPDDDDEELVELVDDLTIDLHEMNLELEASFAPVAALFWDLGQAFPGLEGWNVAATYRGASGLPVDVEVDIQANVELAETEELEAMTMAALLPLQIGLLDHYVPSRIALGVGFEKEARGCAYFDLVRTGWGDATLNIAELDDGSLMIPLVGLSAEFGDGNQHEVVLKDTLGTRLGGEFQFPSWDGPGQFGRVVASARAGGGYEPSALVQQGADTRLLDSDRIWLSVGAGVQHHDPLNLVAGPLAWDAYLEYHFLAPGSLEVPASAETAGLPLDGSDIPIGGRLLAAGLQWSFEY